MIRAIHLPNVEIVSGRFERCGWARPRVRGRRDDRRDGWGDGGLPSIKAGLADAFRPFDRDRLGRYPFLHVIANNHVTLTGPDTAEGRCYLIDFETASKSDPNPLLLLGLYADSYRHIDGAWRITSSKLEVVWPSSEASAAKTRR